jgi:hypothetical protein
VGDTASIDQLYGHDQTQWVAARMRHNDQIQKFNDIINQAQTQWDGANQQLSQQEQARTMQRLQAESSKLLEKIPNWTQSTGKALSEYLASDFTPDELSQINAGKWVGDHRLSVLAHKAMLYDQAKTSATEAKTKLKVVPKFMPPSKRADGITVKKSAFKKASAQFTRSRSARDASAAMGLIPGIDKFL